MKTEQIKHRRELLDRALPLFFGAHHSLQDRVATVRSLPSGAYTVAAAVGALCRETACTESANLLLDALPANAFDEPSPFLGLASVLLYFRGADRLAFRHRHRIEEFFEESLPFYLENAAEFCGVAEAERAQTMAVLFLLGQKTGSAAARDAALRQLCSLERMLEDRSTLSAYNAPAVLASVLHALAAAVNLSEDSDLRARLRKCESTLWHSATQIYDRGAGMLCGSFSSAEKEDLWAEDNAMRLLWDAILGARMPFRPFENGKGSPTLLALASLYAAEDYHCPAASIRHALERPSPYRVALTAEIPPSREEDPAFLPCRYPSGAVSLFAAFHDGFSLATASRPFRDGARTRNFFAAVKRPVVRTEKDVATLFAALAVNGRENGGREISFQGERTALVLFTPKPSADYAVYSELRLFITRYETSLLEMRIGPRPFRSGDEVTFTHAPVCLSFGNVYAAVYPLLGDFCAVCARAENGILSLCMTDGEKEGRPLPPERQRIEKRGFAITFSAREEAGSCEEFCRRAEEYTVKDEWVAEIEERRVSFLANGEHLECALCPHTEGIRYLRANEKNLI